MSDDELRDAGAAGWISKADDDRRELGSHFKGQNRSGRSKWSRVCEVIAYEPGREFAYRTVPGFRFGPSADSSVRRFSIVPTDTGSQLTQSLEPVKVPQAWFRPFIRRFMAQHLDMRDQMRATLTAIKAAAEAATGAPVR